MLTEAIALFKGEFDFSSTIEEIDSTDDIRECEPKGLFGVASPG